MDINQLNLLLYLTKTDWFGNACNPSLRDLNLRMPKPELLKCLFIEGKQSAIIKYNLDYVTTAVQIAKIVCSITGALCPYINQL